MKLRDRHIFLARCFNIVLTWTRIHRLHDVASLGISSVPNFGVFNRYCRGLPVPPAGAKKSLSPFPFILLPCFDRVMNLFVVSISFIIALCYRDNVLPTIRRYILYSEAFPAKPAALDAHFSRNISAGGRIGHYGFRKRALH